MIRGLLSDADWVFFEPSVAESGALRGRPPQDHRRVLDAVFWIARTGAPWRDLPEELGNWTSVRRQFRRWTASGLWDLMLAALAEDGGRGDADGRQHHCPGTSLCRRRKGDSAPGSWPFARRVLDQDPSADHR